MANPSRAHDPVLDQVVAWRGQPQPIRLDIDPELIAERFMTEVAPCFNRTRLPSQKIGVCLGL
jgi:hypothetical protein